VPDETIARLQALELMRCLQPRGSADTARYRVFSKMVRELAHGCGSSAGAESMRASCGGRKLHEGSAARRLDSKSVAVASASVAPSGTPSRSAAAIGERNRWASPAAAITRNGLVLARSAKTNGKLRTLMCILQ